MLDGAGLASADVVLPFVRKSLELDTEASMLKAVDILKVGRA